jgi:hypothetical protein
VEPPLSGGVRAREREIKPECQAITDGGDNAHGAPDPFHQLTNTSEFKTAMTTSLSVALQAKLGAPVK